MSRWIPVCTLLLASLAAAPAPPLESTAEHNNRGIAHFASGRFEEAVKAFRAAAGLTRDAAEPRYNLSLALYRGRLHEEALAALGSTPGGVRATVLRARILRALGRREEAIRAWDEARRSGELDTASLWHLAQVLRQAGEPARAEGVLDELLRRAPEAGVIETERAETLAELKRTAEALAAVKRAAAGLAEGDEEIASILGEAEAARQRGSTEQERTAVSMAANVLRSTEGYVAGAERLSRYGPGSPLSEAPIHLRAEAEPGVAPPPFKQGASEIQVAGARGVCAADAGLWVTGSEGVSLFTRGPEGKWAARRRIPYPAAECAAADLDQDGADDLVLVTADALLVVWPEGEPARLPGAAEGVTLFDYDLDGDADLMAAGPAGARLWRNNRDHTFTDATGLTGLDRAAAGPTLGVIAADLTGDGAAELYVAQVAGSSLVEGLQHERVETSRPLGGAGGPASVADCDHDGDLDLIGAGALLVNDGLGRFDLRPLPVTTGAIRLGSADLDLDGFLDVLALAPSGVLRVLRGTGACELTPWPGDDATDVADVTVADFDRNGVPELAMLAGDRVRFRESAVAGRAIRLNPEGTKDNTDALGSRVEVLAGRLRLHTEIRLGTQEIGAEGPRLLLGLGPRSGAQWVRVSWPNNTWAALEEIGAGPHTVEQSPDLVGSCPFLYCWDGERFAFVTDLLGGSPLGLPLARGVHMPTDSDEYVLLPAGQLVARGGRYDLRVTVELREMLFLDGVELVAVDHPADVVLATDDGLKNPPFRPSRLYASRSVRPPSAAVDHRGIDVLDRLRWIDGRYPDGFQWIPFQGYADPHSLLLDFGGIDTPETAFLVLTGGYYWSEADNLALAQAQTVRPLLPRLEAWVDGRWKAILDPMPFPGGRPKTIAIDLGGALPPGPVRLRIKTNLRLYFDRILLATEDLPENALRVRRLAPADAVLTWHGYSQKGRFDGRVPPPYEYDRVQPGRPFARIEGFYTRYGDVLPLVTAVDNASVVLHHGDEVAFSFEAPPLPPAGWVRDFLFYSVGWDKDAHPNTTAGKSVDPLPFHGMRTYPYSAPERYPWTPALLELDRRYRTRWIPREVR